MKHGDKAKGKTAKAVSKASGEKAGSKGSKAVKGGKGSGKELKAGANGKGSRPEAVKEAGRKAEKGSSPAEAGAGKAPRGARAAADSNGHFTNPLVGAGFKRALKKYPNAFRRLTE